MTEYVVGDRPEADALAGVLAGEFVLRAGETRVGEWVVLDTFDALLRDAGLRLCWQDGRFELLGNGGNGGDRGNEGNGGNGNGDGGGDRGGARRALTAPAAVAPAGPVPVDGLPPGELRDQVRAIVESRALLPLARMTVSEATHAVLDPLQKTVARVRICSPVVLPEHGRPRELATRVQLLAIRGYDEELARVRERLGEALGGAPAEWPLLDEAVLASGRRLEGVASKVDVPLSAEERSDAAAVRVLRALLDVIDANLPGVMADIDPEFLHDFRVSIRRTRAVQRELRRVFPREELARLRAEFRWLQQVTGDSRDLDVYVSGFGSMRELVPASLREELDPLLVVLRRRRLVAHGVMNRELRGERVAALRRDWQALLDGLVVMPEDERPDATRPIGEVSAERIRKVYRRMVRMGTAIGAGGVESPPADYHELRKKGKELRYLLELFGQPLHDPEVVKPLVKALKGLQDILGHHQDREVQVAMLRTLADEVSTLPGGARALMAMGVLIERLDDDAAATRARFAKEFATFSSKPTRRLVEDTFR